MKNKLSRSVGGAVLIMILTVMFVLLIMLMATLTVVSTAGQRIYTKYEENQAYYSARSALDVYVEKLLYDADYMAVNGSGSDWQYIYIDADGNDKTSTSGMKQGLALQLDLYNLTSLNKDVKGNALKDYGIMENAYKGSGVFPDQAGLRDLTAGDSSSPVTSVTYQVKMPTITDMSTGRSRVSDDVVIDSKSYNDITIKVEVLDREYKLGGDNADAFEALRTANETQFLTDLGNMVNDTDVFTGSTLTYGDLKEAIKLGDRTKDQMRLRVTATANFRGEEQKSVLIFDITEPPIINGTRAITSFGTASNLDNTTVVGGVSVPNNATAGNSGSITGNIYVKGNFNNNGAGTHYELVDTECFYVDGDFTWLNSINVKGYNSDPTDKDKRPFIFVDGTYGNSMNAPSAGVVGNEVDLLAQEISGLSNAFSHHGDIYVSGNVDFSGLAAQVPIIDGDLYVGGTITYGQDGGGNDVLPKTSSGTLTSVHAGAVDFSDKDTSTTDKVEIELPNGVKKTLPTEGSIYDEHHHNNNSGDPLYTAEELAYLSKDQRENGETTSKTFATEGAAVTPANQLWVDNGALKSRASSDAIAAVTDPDTTNSLGNVYTLTAGQYTLDPIATSLSGPLLVTGGGTVELYLKAGTYQNNTRIIVDDNTTLKIFGMNPGGTYNFQNFIIANRSIYNAITSGSNVYVGQKGTGMKSPTVSMYFDAGSTVSFVSSYATAYIQCPGANIALNNPISVNNVVYNNTNVGTKKLTIIGSVLCADINSYNEAGVAYINPNVTSNPEGEPFLSFEKQQYKRK